MTNTITMSIENVETFAELISQLQYNGVKFSAEANAYEFIITVTGS